MKSKLPLYIAMISIAAIWGSSFVVMKDSLERQNVFSFLSSRFILAALLMFLYRPGAFRRLTKKFVSRGIIAGILLGSGYIFQTYGLTKTTVSNTGFITGLYLVFTPLISLLLLKRHVLKIQWLAVLIATIGLFFISYNGVTIGVGEILVLISAVIYGAHFVVLGEWSDGENTYALTLIQVVTVAVLTSIFAFRDGFQIAPDSTVWLAILYTAFFATFLGFLVQTKAQSVMSATVASVLLATETPFAVFFGLYFHDDQLTLRIITGGLLVMVAMALVIWSDNRKLSMRRLGNE
ncbi:MAG: DMT family transporter [Actinomycetota bacterium]|nr:DMT family transporter [Actinomycetota bacterium]